VNGVKWRSKKDEDFSKSQNKNSIQKLFLRS
jgi:hypothetical protein